MGNAVSSSSRRHAKGSSRSGSNNGKRLPLSIDDDSRSSHALAFFDNLCGSVVSGENNHNYNSSNHSSKDKKRDSRSTKTKSSSADNTEENRHFRTSTHHSSSSAGRKYSLSHSSGGKRQGLQPRRPRTSYDDDTESEMAESEVDGMEDEHDNDDNDDDDDDEGISTNDDEETDADTMVTDVSELTPAAAAAGATTSGPLLSSSSTNSNSGAQAPMTHHHHTAKPLASSFAKKCYFTKAGIGKMTQHYEGLVHNGGPTVLMLASAMKLKGCPTICDEDLRRVEQSYPNLFSRLPDELMLSSGWRRISKYCHFSNRPIPDGVPFFHSKQKIHPNGGYYFLLASAVGMISPSEVEPLTRDHLVVLETDFPTQCDAAPLPLIQNPTLWTLVTKFCFFSGGPINTDEDVYYQADFGNQTIYMLAFLSPALTPEELYLMDSNSTTTNHTDQNHPIHRSVDAVRDVESVYDLMDRDFDDLKLYHLGPCRALPPQLLQPSSWRKVLPEHFRLIRQLAIERAQAYEEQFGQIHYSTNTNNTSAYPQQQQQQHLSSSAHPETSTMVDKNNGLYATYMEQHSQQQHPQVVLTPNNISSTSQHASPAVQHTYTSQMPFYNSTTTAATINNNNGPFVNASKDAVISPYYTPTYLPYTAPATTTLTASTNGARNLHQPTSLIISSPAADIYPRPHDEVDGMMDLQQDIESVDQSGKVSVVSFGGDVDVEAPMRISTTTTTTTTTDDIRISAPSEIHNDDGDITLTSKTDSNNKNDEMKRSDHSRSSLCNVHTSPQRKSIPETRMNERNDEKKNNSRFDNDNFSCHKRSPADKSAVSSMHLGVDDEDRSIRTGGVIHSRLDGAALDQELIRLPLTITKDQSFNETKRRPFIGLKRSPVRKTESPSHWQNPKEDSDSLKKQDSPNGQKRIEDSDALLKSSTPDKYDECTRNGNGSEGALYPTDLKNGTSQIQSKDSYDDSELMRDVSSSQHNDENDESRFYMSRRDRTIYEDEYSVGRTRARDVKIGNRTVRSASLSSRLRQRPSDIALKKPLQESKQDKTIISSTNTYDSPPPKVAPASKVPMSLKSKNDDVHVLSANISKASQETDYTSSKFLSSVNLDAPSSGSPSTKNSLLHENDEASVASTKYSKLLNDSKVVSSRVLSSYNYVSRGKSSKDSSHVETKFGDAAGHLTTPDFKKSPSKVDTQTVRRSPESEASTRIEDSPIQLSPETANSAEADRSTRRALILKMAKARMQKHKRDLSENPVRSHNNNTIPLTLDLD